MDIIYLGHSSFYIKGSSASVVTDPFEPSSVGIRFPKVAAEIVTISHNHDDHNKAELVDGVKKVIQGAGEYEVEGVSIIGISSYHDSKKGQERGLNTIYVFEIDKLRIAHLGDLGHKLDDKTLEEIGDIDVLMIPVGGVYTIGPQEAVFITRAIEPRLVIPMHFNSPGLNPKIFSDLKDENAFVNELGLPVKRQKKLSIKSNDLSDENGEIVVLDLL